MQVLQKYHDSHWIFGNWAGLDKNLIPSIIANLTYSVLEYDYKFCNYRSPEKHALAEGHDCGCEKTPLGTLVGAFYYGASSLWWMSERQQSRYLERYPFLKDRNQSVLSSVFGEDFWVNLKRIREETKDTSRKGWLVLGSSSWVKGTEDAIEWCEKNGREYEILQGLSPVEVLEKMARAEGFVYLPRGGDTCPRVVIEAKLLGCKLHLNENVEHKDEIWFSTDNLLDTESYLYAARETFWNGVKGAMSWRPTISGYTTTKDCISQGYPWEKTVESMLGFCDEVVVVDGGSTDGTWERLTQLASENEKLVVSQVKRDWGSKRFAVFDGTQKAEARKLCTKEFCWQMDADEVLPEKDWRKVHELCRRLTPEIDLVSLPVVEYWGSKEKVRIDVTPWKWRLSRNKSYITHGIPGFLREHDADGSLYAKQGTDGCDYVHAQTGDLIPHVSFYTEQAHHARVYAVMGDKDALRDYGNWFVANVNGLPSVRHYSWIDIERKIKTYRGYWQRHWESLYDIRQEDTAENNMFFDSPWSEVTDEMIASLAKRLANEMGGHVFHSKVDWSKPTPHLSIPE
jgi:glycosyltransferase involved in cell wall biosynthesis